MPGDERIEVIAQQGSFYSTNPKAPPAMPILEVVGERELPDAIPNEQQRQVLKGLARSLRVRFSSRELAYLASAVEVEANLIRGAEEVRG